MSEQNDITLLRIQKKLKPLIEDVIPHYLDDENKKIALEFIAYLRENKMNPVWAGIHNTWKTDYKGKCLFYIRLCIDNPYREKKQWVINPYLLHIQKYEELIIEEGLQNLLWDNVHHCKNVLTGGCNSHNCSPGRNITVLDKEIKSVCLGRQPFWFYEPDKTAINCIKKLMDFERQVRKIPNKKMLELSSPSKCQIDNLQNEKRTCVLKITNPDSWAVVLYNLSKYKNKRVTLQFSVDIKRVGTAGTLAWQLNNEDYPLVGMPIDNAPADTWHTMSGEWLGILTADFPLFFLSAYENNSKNTTYYIDNFAITITPTA